MTIETTTQEAVKQEVTTPAQAASVETGKDGTPFDATRAQALIEKLQAENKDYKATSKRLADLEAKEQARADAQLTKEQQLEKQVAEAKADAVKARMEANAKLLKSAVLLKAAAMGFEHPTDAFALADLSAITADEAGDYDEKLIEAALKPLAGRLPTKTQGDRVGTPKLPQNAKQSENNLATRDLYQKSPRY